MEEVWNFHALKKRALKDTETISEVFNDAEMSDTKETILSKVIARKGYKHTVTGINGEIFVIRNEISTLYEIHMNIVSPTGKDELIHKILDEMLLDKSVNDIMDQFFSTFVLKWIIGKTEIKDQLKTIHEDFK